MPSRPGGFFSVQSSILHSRLNRSLSAQKRPLESCHLTDSKYTVPRSHHLPHTLPREFSRNDDNGHSDGGEAITSLRSILQYQVPQDALSSHLPLVVPMMPKKLRDISGRSAGPFCWLGK